MEIKRQKKSDIDIDRLSDLPHHVLLHIIEFMNIKQAFQTCVLSKQWKDLWKHLTNLKLHHYFCQDKSDIFCKFVSQILSGRNDSIPLHTLYFEHVDWVPPPKSILLEVMRYAASHKVKQLTVIAQVNLELPPSLFYCRSLTYLKLGFWKTMFPKSLKTLPSLKTLHLEGLIFITSDDGCAEPFSACNMLDTLIIIGCYLQDDAQALCISNSNVSNLTVASGIVCYEAHTYKIVLCTPKLTSLTIRSGHRTFEAPPSACNLPFLEEVNINIEYIRWYEHSIMISWLQLIANVKIVTLNFKALCYITHALKNIGSLDTQPPCFVRLKSLNVELNTEENIHISNEEVRRMSKNLLQNSPPARVDIIRMNA